MVYLTVCSRRHERRMAHDSEAARARAKPASGNPNRAATMLNRREMLSSASYGRRRSGCERLGSPRKHGSASGLRSGQSEGAGQAAKPIRNPRSAAGLAGAT